MNGRFRFGCYEFDADSGQLNRQADGSPTTSTRLPPQPSRLLCLLLESYPDIVTRQAIRQAIWPDVEVDFDRSLHFCVRQIRNALNESAAAPEFIETIPRRGYRWLVAPEAVAANLPPDIGPPSQNNANDTTSTVVPPRTRWRRWMMPVSLALVAMALVAIWLTRGGAPHGTRVAIMPMQPREGAVAFANNSFAEEVLASLADLRDPALEIVGPTTSTEYDQPEGGIRKLVDDLHIEFVINGRFIHSDGSDRILLEIIRGADGAHVWVRSFGVDASGEEIAGAVQDGLVEHIRKKGD